MSDLSSEQRWALRHLRGRPRGEAFLGGGNDEVPRTTARALQRRGLVGMDGYKVWLTSNGREAAHALSS